MDLRFNHKVIDDKFDAALLCYCRPSLAQFHLELSHCNSTFNNLVFVQCNIYLKFLVKNRFTIFLIPIWYTICCSGCSDILLIIYMTLQYE